MSIRVMTNVWDHSQQEGSTLLLLLAIADHAGDDGFCWPGTERLAQKIRMSVRSVYRANGKNFEPFYKFKEPCTHSSRNALSRDR